MANRCQVTGRVPRSGTRGNKIIDKRGIESVINEIRQRGEKV